MTAPDDCHRRNTRSRTRIKNSNFVGAMPIRCNRSPSLCTSDPPISCWRRHCLKIVVFFVFVLIGAVFTYPKLPQQFDIRPCMHIIQKRLAEIADLLPESTNIANTETNMQRVPDTQLMEQIRLVVRKEVEEYNADKIGQPDYALESAGARVLSTRDTECYNRKGSAVSLFGIPLCPTGNCPKTLIQPGVMPGECWAFKGQEGTAIIQLITKIHVTGFTVEHVSRYISPRGEMSAAPKEFSVWGLKSPADEKGFYFGEFMYDVTGAAVQYFSVLHKSWTTFDIVKFTVHSNHGHPAFTCVYRIRVHGEPEPSQRTEFCNV